MPIVPQFRVFVSSPGDLKEERQAVREVIGSINDDPDYGRRVNLRAELYDHPDYPVAMEAGITPQTSVNRYLVKPSDCDVTVLLLWGRLGTPLADVTRPDGTRYESGTVWEFEDALAARRPVYAFRRDEVPSTKLGDPAKVAAAMKQYDAVQAFVAERFGVDGEPARGGLNAYHTLDEFKRLLRRALEQFVNARRADDGSGRDPLTTRPAVKAPYLVPDHTRRDYELVRRTDKDTPGAADDVATVWARLEVGHNVFLSFLPGVGKSTLAEEVVAERQRVMAHFDGVLWADVGRRPEPLEQLRGWAVELGLSLEPSEAGEMASLGDYEDAIRRAIGERRLLVVLDDVWDESHAREYMRMGRRCVYIVTTRNRLLATKMAQSKADVVTVRELSTDEGLRLLESLAPDAVAADPDGARNLVRLVRGLPLALVLIGKYLKQAAVDPNDRRNILAAIDTLRRAGELLKEKAEDRENPRTGDAMTLAEIIDASYDALAPAGRRALPRLSILRTKPHGFGDDLASEICGVDPADIRSALVPMGLVECKSNNDFTIHPIIASYGLTKLPPQRRRELYRQALDWYGNRLTGAIDADPDSYRDWYRYEKADWQATKDNWLYYLAACDPEDAMFAFLRVFFDAFWWWGYYQRFPFCERLIREWQLRSLGEKQRRGLDQLLRFHEHYPEGPFKTGRADDWRQVEDALTFVRRELGLDGDFADIGAGDARRVRSFLDFFLAECQGYGRNDRAAAIRRYTEAHDEFVAEAVPWVPPWIWFYVGQYLLDIGDPAAALDYTRRALDEAGEDVAFEDRDPELLANIHRALGDLLLHAGDTDGAVADYGRALAYAFAFQAVPEPADTYTVEFYREIAGRVADALLRARATSLDAALRAARHLHHLFDPWWQRSGGALDDVALIQALAGDAATLQARLFPAVPAREAVGVGSTSADFQKRVLPLIPALRVAAQIRADPAP